MSKESLCMPKKSNTQCRELENLRYGNKDISNIIIIDSVIDLYLVGISYKARRLELILYIL